MFQAISTSTVIQVYTSMFTAQYVHGRICFLFVIRIPKNDYIVFLNLANKFLPTIWFDNGNKKKIKFFILK